MCRRWSQRQQEATPAEWAAEMRHWIFFALGAHPTSLRKAIAHRLVEQEPVWIVERPVSGLRQPWLFPLQSRISGGPLPTANTSLVSPCEPPSDPDSSSSPDAQWLHASEKTVVHAPTDAIEANWPAARLRLSPTEYQRAASRCKTPDSESFCRKAEMTPISPTTVQQALRPKQFRPFHLPQRLPLPIAFRQRLAHWNEERLLRELDSQLLPGPRIVCFDSPHQYPLVGRLGESRSIYLAVDDRTCTLAGTPIDGEVADEQELLRRVDAVICVSNELAEVLRQRRPSNCLTPIHVLENGFDERIFKPVVEPEIPEPVRTLSHPWLLVVGTISQRIDWEAVAACRRHLPELPWVFLGPIADPESRRHLRELGLLHHPPVPLAEVPAWIAAADACVIPYRLNAFTKASCPLKAYEYLALGAATVSTPVPSLLSFGTAIEWAQPGKVASYLDAIHAALQSSRNPEARARRCAAVAHASFAQRTEQFLQMVLPPSSRRRHPAKRLVKALAETLPVQDPILDETNSAA